MAERSGPFWDGIQGRVPMPRAAATLGFEFIDADAERGTIQVAFTATEAFTNPAGNVLGAFVAAMLYDTPGPALLSTLQWAWRDRRCECRAIAGTIHTSANARRVT